MLKAYNRAKSELEREESQTRIQGTEDNPLGLGLMVTFMNSFLKKAFLKGALGKPSSRKTRSTLEFFQITLRLPC